MRTRIRANTARSSGRSRPIPLVCFPLHGRAPEIPPAGQVGPRGDQRGGAGDRLRRSRDRRGVRGRRKAAAACPISERAAVGGGEPSVVRLLAGAARAEGPQRLPPLRPPAPRGRALNHTMRLWLALTLAVLVLGLVSACGGGGGNESAQTLPPAPALTVPGGEEAPPDHNTGTTGATGATGATGSSTPSSNSGGGSSSGGSSAPSTTVGSAGGGAQAPSSGSQQQSTTAPSGGAQAPSSKGLSDFCKQNPGAC